MTPEEKRQAVANAMGFKDPGFLRWLDGAYEFEEQLIKREQAAGSDAAHRDYACWENYLHILEAKTMGHYGGVAHATVTQRIDAYLELREDGK